MNNKTNETFASFKMSNTQVNDIILGYLFIFHVEKICLRLYTEISHRGYIPANHKTRGKTARKKQVKSLTKYTRNINVSLSLL